MLTNVPLNPLLWLSDSTPQTLKSSSWHLNEGLRLAQSTDLWPFLWHCRDGRDDTGETCCSLMKKMFVFFKKTQIRTILDRPEIVYLALSIGFYGGRTSVMFSPSEPAWCSWKQILKRMWVEVCLPRRSPSKDISVTEEEGGMHQSTQGPYKEWSVVAKRQMQNNLHENFDHDPFSPLYSLSISCPITTQH